MEFNLILYAESLAHIYIAHGLASCHTRARIYKIYRQLRRYIVLQGCDAWNRRYVTFFTIPGISSSIWMILFVRFPTVSLTVKSVWCLCVWTPLHKSGTLFADCGRIDDAMHAESPVVGPPLHEIKCEQHIYTVYIPTFRLKKYNSRLLSCQSILILTKHI
jgi:hypothetical protein